MSTVAEQYAMAHETNGLTNPDEYYAEQPEFMTLHELVASGGKVTRVRWLAEAGRADLSYVHGHLPDGTRVSITHTPAAFLVPLRQRKGVLIDWAKSERVFAKGCGLLDEANWSTLA